MKKSLIAVAVAAALPAFAQAQTNVTLYGIMDLGASWVDQDKTGADGQFMIISGVQSTSRFGIRGSEDLGGGLSAVFNLEAGVSADTGDTNTTANAVGGQIQSVSNNLFQRRSVVGLKGGFGEVLLGRDYTPGFSAQGTVDVMGYGLWGNLLGWSVNGGTLIRASNGIHYTSPVIGATKCAATPAPTECGAFDGGLTIKAMYATGENTGTGGTGLPTDAGNVYGLSAVWKGAMLNAMAYWHQGKLPTAATNQLTQYGIGGGWTQGIFRIQAGYAAQETEAIGATGQDVKFSGYHLGGGVKLGGGELLAQWLYITNDLPGDPESNTFGIAYTYPMSKRTNVYASWGMTDNANNAQMILRASDFGVGGVSGPLATDRNGSPTAFSVGVRHMF